MVNVNKLHCVDAPETLDSVNARILNSILSVGK